jgi:glycosyltransferase 2 family protein
MFPSVRSCAAQRPAFAPPLSATVATPALLRPPCNSYAETLGAGDADPGLARGSGRDRRALPSARTALIIVGVAVSAGFMYIAVRNAHFDETVDAFAETDVLMLVPAVALLVVAFFVRAIRWRSLFARTRRPSLPDVVSALFVGYLANAVLPVRAGEAAAIVALNRKARSPIAEATGTMLVQRAQDVLALVLLLFLMLPWLPEVSWLRAAGIIALALLLALAVLVAVVLKFGERPLRSLVRPLRWLPSVPAETIERAPGHFVYGLTGLVSPRVAAVSFGWTMLSWMIVGLGFWVVMEASGLELSPLAGELVVIGIGLAMILPSSPAALGVFEGATVIVLAAYGVAASEALSYALVLHALNVVPLFIVAAVIVLIRWLRPSVRSKQPVVQER